MSLPTLDQSINYVSFAIGIIGLFVAFVQYNEKRKLNEYVRANNWFNYQRIENTNGTVQLAKNLYLRKSAQNIDAEILDRLSMADAHGQELLKEAIRQIQISEPSFTSNDFDRWEHEGKISNEKVALFKRFAVDPDSRRKLVVTSKLPPA